MAIDAKSLVDSGVASGHGENSRGVWSGGIQPLLRSGRLAELRLNIYTHATLICGIYSKEVCPCRRIRKQQIVSTIGSLISSATGANVNARYVQ